MGEREGWGRGDVLLWKLASWFLVWMNCWRSRWSEGERRAMSSCEREMESSPASMFEDLWLGGLCGGNGD